MLAALQLEPLCQHHPAVIAGELTTWHPELHDGWPCPFYRCAAVLNGALDPADRVAMWLIPLDALLDAKGRVPLSLNDRLHWAAHAKAVSRIKAITRQRLLDADIAPLSHVHVELHYRPASNRFRDEDNLVATLKPIIDALHTPDEAENVPIPYVPIVAGDDPRFVSWSRPILHPWIKGVMPSLWVILRSMA